MLIAVPSAAEEHGKHTQSYPQGRLSELHGVLEALQPQHDPFGGGSAHDADVQRFPIQGKRKAALGRWALLSRHLPFLLYLTLTTAL